MNVCVLLSKTLPSIAVTRDFLLSGEHHIDVVSIQLLIWKSGLRFSSVNFSFFS